MSKTPSWLAARRPKDYQLETARLLAVDVKDPRVTTEALEQFFRAVQAARLNPLTRGYVAAGVVEVLERGIREFIDHRTPAPLSGPAHNEINRNLLILKNLASALDAIDRRIGPLDEPRYHHNGHNLLVMAVSLVMERANQGNQEWTAGKLIRLTQRLIDALDHDHGHDGTNNRIEKIGKEYVVHDNISYGRLELASVKLLSRIYEHSSLPFAQQQFSKWVHYSTDPSLPDEILKSAYALHTEDGTDPRGRIAVMDFEEIAKQITGAAKPQRMTLLKFMLAVGKSRPLADAAMHLKPSDMISLGLGVKLWEELCNAFDEEQRINGSGIFIVDANKKPLPCGQWEAAAKLAGARIRPDSTITPCFLPRAADELFGRNLTVITEIAEGQLRRPERDAMKAAFLDIYHPFGEADQTAWRGFLSASPEQRATLVGLDS